MFDSCTTSLVAPSSLGMAPLFMGLTRGRTEAYKHEAAIRRTVVGAAILFLLAFARQGGRLEHRVSGLHGRLRGGSIPFWSARFGPRRVGVPGLRCRRAFPFHLEPSALASPSARS